MGSNTPSAEVIDGSLYLIRHVFLPPKLPETEDTTGPRLERLVQDVCTSLQMFHDLDAMTGSQRAAIKRARVAMVHLYNVHDFEGDAVGITSDLLEKALKTLLKAGKLTFNSDQLHKDSRS